MQDCLFCARCKTTFEEFLQTGMIGCAFCYTTFRKNLLITIEKTQGKTKHCGKKPPWSPVQQFIFNKKFGLRNELDDAIKQKNDSYADFVYKQLQAIADLEKLYEKQLNLEKEIEEKLEFERIKAEQNTGVVVRESEKYKAELHALKYTIQKLENEICG